MSEVDHFEAYGRAAAALTDRTVMAGRYGFQRGEEAGIPGDVAAKLRLGPADRLLEIGCGNGEILRALASLVDRAVGIDHPSCLDAFRSFGVPGNVALVPGRWPDVDPGGTFTKAYAYSVLHYLTGADEAFAFVDAAVAVLEPGGWLLLGDVPNVDARRRFQQTEFGRRFAEEWAARVAAEATAEEAARDEIFEAAPAMPPYLTDDFVASVLGRYRSLGHEAYVVPQPDGLPFCHTREDLLLRVARR